MIIWAVGRCREKELAPNLIKDLSHENAEIRKVAYEAIVNLELSKEPIPAFDSKAPPPGRERQVKLIQEWFEKATKNL